MTTKREPDIREAAARAAREWNTTAEPGSTLESIFAAGYLAGYEAAKAEADEWRVVLACGVCGEDFSEDNHGVDRCPRCGRTQGIRRLP